MKSAALLLAALICLAGPSHSADASDAVTSAASAAAVTPETAVAGDAAAVLSRHAHREAAEEAAAPPGTAGDDPETLVSLDEARPGLDGAAGAREALEPVTPSVPDHARPATGDDVRAREYRDAAVALDTDTPEVLAEAAWALMYAGDLEDGMASVRGGLARFPDDRSLLLAAAFALFRTGQYDSVDDVIRKLISLRMDDPEAIAQGIMLSIVSGDGETADMALGYLRAIGEDSPFFHLAAGFYHLAAGDNHTAVMAYRTALEGELPLHDRYHATHNLAALLTGAGEYGDALALARESLAMLEANPGLDGKPSRWAQNSLIGFLLQQLGDDAAAAERFAGTIAAGYGRETDYLRHAAILRKGGRTEEALAVLRAGRERYPDDIHLLSLAARILIATGRSGDAVELLRKVAAAQPRGLSEEKEAAWAKRLLKIVDGK